MLVGVGRVRVGGLIGQVGHVEVESVEHHVLVHGARRRLGAEQDDDVLVGLDVERQVHGPGGRVRQGLDAGGDAHGLDRAVDQDVDGRDARDVGGLIQIREQAVRPRRQPVNRHLYLAAGIAAVDGHAVADQARVVGDVDGELLPVRLQPRAVRSGPGEGEGDPLERIGDRGRGRHRPGGVADLADLAGRPALHVEVDVDDGTADRDDGRRRSRTRRTCRTSRGAARASAGARHAAATPATASGRGAAAAPGDAAHARRAAGTDGPRARARARCADGAGRPRARARGPRGARRPRARAGRAACARAGSRPLTGATPTGAGVVAPGAVMPPLAQASPAPPSMIKSASFDVIRSGIRHECLSGTDPITKSGFIMPRDVGGAADAIGFSARIDIQEP